MMSLSDMSIEERINCFIELLSCNERCFIWTYDTKGKLKNTNCEYNALNKIFISAGLLDFLLEYIKTSSKFTILSVAHGLLWGIAFEKNSKNKIKYIHIYGPVFSQELSSEAIAKMVNTSKVSASWRPKFVKILNKIPVKMYSVFLQECIMFNYCITNEVINTADIIFQSPKARYFNIDESTTTKDRLKTYMAEQELLRMVREGNLHYQKALQSASYISVGVNSGEEDTLAKAKISLTVFVSLCTRAAIEGGISPEIAYSKGDSYISDITQCTIISDATRISHTMYEDFIQTVHNHQTDPSISNQIQSCCDYIETHLEEKIELATLAKRIGYSEYYLSRKFKKETGVSISEYIRNARINRAKILLASTQMSIQNISNRLCFGNRSFFADTFSKVVGVPPAEYRKQNQRL